MAYRVNIIPGHRADCPDGYALQGETTNIVSEIENLSRMCGLGGPDILLEFSPIIERGKVANPKPKDRGQGMNYHGEEWPYNEYPFDRPNRHYFEEEDYIEWNESNRYNLYRMMDMIEKNDLCLRGYDEFSKIVKQCQGNLNIEDIKDYIMSPGIENNKYNWVSLLREKMVENMSYSEKYQTILNTMQSTFGFLAASTSMTLGCYCTDTRKIIIYDVAIKNMYPHCYKEAMMATYAHELFHAVHHDEIKNNHSPRDEELIVLESLASYFEFFYCNSQANRGISPRWNRELANDLYNEWNMYDVIDWPYSGAIAMVDLQHVPGGHDYLFSRTYKKSTVDMVKSYDDVINAYATHEGRSLKGGIGLGHAYQPWPVGEYFWKKKNNYLETLYNELFSEMQRYVPSAFADSIYSLDYIRVRDNAVKTKKKRSRAFAIIKFERKTNSLYLEIKQPTSYLPGITFNPTKKSANFPYSFNIHSRAEISMAAKALKDSYDQLI